MTIKIAPGTRSLCVNLAVFLTVLAGLFLIGEITLRLSERRLIDFDNQILRRHQDGILMGQYDPNLGWAPKPGFYPEKWPGKSVHIQADGLRANGGSQPSSLRPLILAAGDSFTFGDQVADHESWPAMLENYLGIRVLNGGVFGYGLDQIVLRAEQLANRFQPDLLIINFIWDDIDRCGLRVRSGRGKPYFDEAGGNFILRNNPVPLHPQPPRALSSWRRVLGHSFLLDRFLSKIAPSRWRQGFELRVPVSNNPLKISRYLFERLDEWAARNRVAVVIVYTPTFKSVEVSKYLRSLDLKRAYLLDLSPSFAHVLKSDPISFVQFHASHPNLKGHLSAEGNAFVAKEIGHFLEQEGLLPVLHKTPVTPVTASLMPE